MLALRQEYFQARNPNEEYSLLGRLPQESKNYLWDSCHGSDSQLGWYKATATVFLHSRSQSAIPTPPPTFFFHHITTLCVACLWSSPHHHSMSHCLSCCHCQWRHSCLPEIGLWNLTQQYRNTIETQKRRNLQKHHYMPSNLDKNTQTSQIETDPSLLLSPLTSSDSSTSPFYFLW